MAKNLTVYLPPEERKALMHMSIEDVRPPIDQIRFLIISEAKRRGILKNEKSVEMNSGNDASIVEAECVKAAALA